MARPTSAQFLTGDIVHDLWSPHPFTSPWPQNFRSFQFVSHISDLSSIPGPTNLEGVFINFALEGSLTASTVRRKTRRTRDKSSPNPHILQERTGFPTPLSVLVTSVARVDNAKTKQRVDWNSAISLHTPPLSAAPATVQVSSTPLPVQPIPIPAHGGQILPRKLLALLPHPTVHADSGIRIPPDDAVDIPPGFYFILKNSCLFSSVVNHMVEKYTSHRVMRQINSPGTYSH